MGPTIRNRTFLYLLLLTVAFWWLKYYPPTTDAFVFDDDASKHVYWMERFRDPELFKNDLTAELFSSYRIAPPGYQLIYRAGSLVTSPIQVSRWLSLVTAVLSLYLLFEICTRVLSDPRGRFLACFIFILYGEYKLSGGLQRSFFTPLLLLCMWLMLRRGFAWSLSVIPLQAMFYPPAVINTAAFAGGRLVERLRSDSFRRILRQGVLLTLVTGLSIAVLLGIVKSTDRGVAGPQVTYEEAVEMPEFHAGGRSEYFFDNPFYFYFLAPRSSLGGREVLGVFGVFLLMLAAGGYKTFRPPEFSLTLIWTSFVLYVLAHLVLFKLYEPSRYVMFTWPVAFILFIGACAGGAADTVGGFFSGLKRRLRLGALADRTARVLLLVVPFLLVGLLAQTMLDYEMELQAVGPQEQEMLDAIASLPKDTLVAGHPYTLDNVPAMSKRPVLISYELTFQYYLGYYSKVRARTIDMLEAYYAKDMKPVETLMDRYGVDVMLVEKQHFTPERLRKTIYRVPFEEMIRKKLSEPGDFIFENPPKNSILFENDRYRIVDLHRLAHPLTADSKRVDTGGEQRPL